MMSTGWHQAYTELADFVGRHAEIETGVSVISIAESVRPEFYRLFDAVRVSFLEEKLPILLSQAKTLSQSYITVEEVVLKLLRVVDIILPGSLRSFLHDPANDLRGHLFHLLFDLLKRKTNTAAFEHEAIEIIESSFSDLYHLGYGKWVGLSLVRLLETDKVFHVDCPETLPDEREKDFYSQERVAAPEESQHLHFDLGQGLSFVFAVSDFIVHSARIDRYIAVRSVLDEAKWSASNASKKREWYPLDPIKRRYGLVALQPDLLIYIDEEIEDIALVADADKICRPDLIIEFRERKGWYEKQGLDEIELHHDVLRPKLGTYVVSREPLPEQGTEKQGEGIHILTVGFDQSKLEPIISRLKNQEDLTLPPETATP